MNKSEFARANASQNEAQINFCNHPEKTKSLRFGVRARLLKLRCGCFELSDNDKHLCPQHSVGLCSGSGTWPLGPRRSQEVRQWRLMAGPQDMKRSNREDSRISKRSRSCMLISRETGWRFCFVGAQHWSKVRRVVAVLSGRVSPAAYLRNLVHANCFRVNVLGVKEGDSVLYV